MWIKETLWNIQWIQPFCQPLTLWGIWNSFVTHCNDGNPAMEERQSHTEPYFIPDRGLVRWRGNHSVHSQCHVWEPWHAPMQWCTNPHLFSLGSLVWDRANVPAIIMRNVWYSNAWQIIQYSFTKTLKKNNKKRNQFKRQWTLFLLFIFSLLLPLTRKILSKAAQTWWTVPEHPTDGLLLPIALYTFLFGLHGALLWCGASHRKSKTGCDHFRGQVPAHSHSLCLENF